MFEVNVKNVMKKGREGKGRRGPARVWGFDWQENATMNTKSKCNIIFSSFQILF